VGKKDEKTHSHVPHLRRIKYYGTLPSSSLSFPSNLYKKFPSSILFLSPLMTRIFCLEGFVWGTIGSGCDWVIVNFIEKSMQSFLFGIWFLVVWIWLGMGRRGYYMQYFPLADTNDFPESGFRILFMC